jgi:methyltransferase family protein
MFVPYSAVLGARVLRNRRYSRRALEGVVPAAAAVAPQPFDEEEAVRVLVAHGLDESNIRGSSIGATHQRFLDRVIHEHLHTHPPHRALQIGNFVGVSLAALSASLLDVAGDTDPVVASIDPNIPHDGVTDPQTAAMTTLSHFGYQPYNVVICGYSLEKSLGGDDIRTEDYDPKSAYTAETACENVLLSLTGVGLQLDVAVVDGSHNAAFLRRELEAIVPLLRVGGLLILDDVSDVWVGIQEVFGELGAPESIWPLEVVDHDGKLGVSAADRIGANLQPNLDARDRVRPRSMTASERYETVTHVSGCAAHAERRYEDALR